MAASPNINLRYIDSVRDEPKKMLTAISGYEKVTVKSVDDACESIKDLFDERLNQYVLIAKINSIEPEDELSPDESASIHLYTIEWDVREHSLYMVLNKTLRSVDRTKLQPWFKYLKLFLTAFFKLPPSKDTLLWRGVREDLSALYPKGKEFAWWAFTSCTASISVLKSNDYLGKSGTRTMFSIQTNSGKHIRAHSYFENEDEILLPPGIYFKVIDSLIPAEGLYIIHLQEIPPPFQTLAKPFDLSQLKQALPDSKPSENYPTESVTSQTSVQPSSVKAMVRDGFLCGDPNGGGPFDDKVDLQLSETTYCVGFEVFWRSHLFAIRFIYEWNDSSIRKVYHGDSHNADPPLFSETFLLSKEERINKVVLYVGTGDGSGNMWICGDKIIRYVMGIQFYTTTGRMSRLYGVKSGEVFTESYEGYTLGYVKGRSGLLVDMLQFMWYNQEYLSNTYDEVWIEAQDGRVPPDAVVGGQEGNRRVYVVRFKIQGRNMIPGKLIEGSKMAEGLYCGVHTSSTYQVLTNPDPKKKFNWVTTSGNNMPEGAFLTGKEEENNLYMGRVLHSSNLILIGKYNASHGALLYTHEGEEKRLDRNFEVLCVS